MSNSLRLCLKQSVFVLGLIVIEVHSAYAQIGFTKRMVGEVFEGVHALQAADLNNDGKKEIVGASLDAIILWEQQDSNWVADTVSNSFEGARFVDVGDIDGDNDLDLFGAAKGIDTITWWENADGSADVWVEHVVDSSFDFAIHVYAHDIDGDDDMDLFGAALKDDAITWWENLDGSGDTWTRHNIDENFDGARHVCVVDIDGDQDLDIVGSADIANTIAWWENTGPSGGWIKHVVDSTFEGVNAVYPEDIDGDGRQDLVAVADLGDEIAWWKNVFDGSITWERITIRSNYDGAFSVYPVDMDGDNDIDIVGAANFGDEVAWWENAFGNGLVWQEHLIEEEFDAPSFVIANDIDKDGDVDVLAGTLKSSELSIGEVVWWENNALLPVELSGFEALVDGDDVHLAWRTISELNNSGFEIQYMTADVQGGSGEESWMNLAFVKGQGTTNNPVSYTYNAGSFEYGSHLFRLRQVDFDGGYSFSEVAQVVIGIHSGLNMTSPYPNPFNPQTQFALHIPVSQRVTINVYNSIGQRVKNLYEGELDSGKFHQFEFQANSLPGGMYVIQVLGDQFSESRRVLLIK